MAQEWLAMEWAAALSKQSSVESFEDARIQDLSVEKKTKVILEALVNG